MATTSYRPDWAYGRRANRGYSHRNGGRTSLTAVHYDTYKLLHKLAQHLTEQSGKRVPLNAALDRALVEAAYSWGVDHG